MIQLLLPDRKLPRGMKPYKCVCDTCQGQSVIAIAKYRPEALQFFESRGWGADVNHQTCQRCTRQLAEQIRQFLTSNELTPPTPEDTGLPVLAGKVMMVHGPDGHLSIPPETMELLRTCYDDPDHTYKLLQRTAHVSKVMDQQQLTELLEERGNRPVHQPTVDRMIAEFSK